MLPNPVQEQAQTGRVGKSVVCAGHSQRTKAAQGSARQGFPSLRWLSAVLWAQALRGEGLHEVCWLNFKPQVLAWPAVTLF